MAAPLLQLRDKVFPAGALFIVRRQRKRHLQVDGSAIVYGLPVEPKSLDLLEIGGQAQRELRILSKYGDQGRRFGKLIPRDIRAYLPDQGFVAAGRQGKYFLGDIPFLDRRYDIVIAAFVDIGIAADGFVITVRFLGSKREIE